MYVISIPCFVVCLLAYMLLIPFLASKIMNSGLFACLWTAGLIGGFVVYMLIGTRYMVTTFRLKHTWLTSYGSEVTATITKHKIERHHTPSGDPDPMLCFQLSWSHPASKSRVSTWKRLPFGLEYERDSSGQEKISDGCMQKLERFKPQAQLTVLCDPTDPNFFLTLNPMNPSRYPLPAASGHLLEEGLMTLGI